MQSLRSRAFAVGAGLVVMGGVAAGTAIAASDPVVVAIKGQEKVLKSSAAVQDLKHIKIKTPAQAKKDLPKFRLLASKLDQAATAVSQASATTAQEKRGQTDWVAGVRKVATGFTQFEGTLRDVERGDKTAASSSALTAVKSIDSGSTLLLKADKILHLKTGSTTG